MSPGRSLRATDGIGRVSSVGAVADMFDISCLYGTPEFANIQNDAYDIWQKCNRLDVSESKLIPEFLQKFNIPLVGYHYFINDNGTLRPKFDFTSAGSTKGNPDAFVVATKAVDVPAPRNCDIDWLELTALSGKLADEVFRVYTRAGRPPTSVSSFRLYLTYSIDMNLRCSAPQDQVLSLSSMQHNTVSA